MNNCAFLYYSDKVITVFSMKTKEILCLSLTHWISYVFYQKGLMKQIPVAHQKE